MKQYLLMVDEVGMAMLQHMLKPGCMQFLAVEGMPLNNDGRYHVMITPVIPPVPPADLTPPAPEQHAPDPQLVENAAKPPATE